MLKIFLVDDSIYIRRRLARMLLQTKGVKIVGEATEAGEANLAIQRLKPDVVLLDVRLAGQTTGLNVLQSVKQAQPAPLVIVLTNYPHQQVEKKYLSAGADFFFDKSTEFDQVVPIVERLVHKTAHRKAPRAQVETAHGQPGGVLSF